MKHLLRIRLIFFIILSAPIMAEAEELRLVMVEEQGCVWCARWNDEIGPIYPKTNEGRAAPLRRMDLHEAQPKDITFVKSLQFTPTFVLIRDGYEVNRIEGYPGEDFFWGLLGTMLEEVDAQGD